MARSKTTKATAKAASSTAKSKWTESERIALLVSVINSFGPGKVQWTKVERPQNRTTGTCAKQYKTLLETAALVPMAAAEPSPGSKRKAKARGQGPNKRARKGEGVEEEEEGEAGEEEEEEEAEEEEDDDEEEWEDEPDSDD